MAKTQNEKNEKNEKLAQLFKKTSKNSYYKTIINLKTGRKGIQLEKHSQAYEKLCSFILDNENIKNFGITEYYINAIKNLKHENINAYNIDGIEKIHKTYYFTTIYDDMLEYDVIKTILDEYV